MSAENHSGHRVTLLISGSRWGTLEHQHTWVSLGPKSLRVKKKKGKKKRKVKKKEARFLKTLFWVPGSTWA